MSARSFCTTWKLLTVPPPFVPKSQPLLPRSRRFSSVDRAHQTEPFDESLYEGEDPEVIEEAKQEDIRYCPRDLLLVERAKKWLLAEEGK